MAKGWKSTDSNQALRSLKRALDSKHDPKYLEKIAREAPLDNIRKLAKEYKEELEGYVERAEKNDPKCPKCGAPMVEAPYYTATKGTSTVTNVKTDMDWASGRKKTTYTTNTPYSNIQLHTAPFCPRCASRKCKRLLDPAICLLLGGIGAVLVFGVLLIVRLADKTSSDQQGLIAIIGLGASILISWIGYKLLGISKGVATWANKKIAPITTEEFEARERGIAFYGPTEFFSASYDISSQYVTSRTLADIPHEETANTALSTGFVRQMREKGTLL